MGGDALAMRVLESVTNNELTEAFGPSTMTLEGRAVVNVLQALGNGQIRPADAQRWASFVRRGYIARAASPIRPLAIDWEVSFEEEIAEATMRLDELGDLVDGTIDSQEIEHLVGLFNRE
ncbi:hypothetical protein SAMN05444157_3081 [Frankineae bacterium MT45]|nr:hypothetical protein SAMN05444157_3081 [Frankineae bacterium MT45]